MSDEQDTVKRVGNYRGTNLPQREFERWNELAERAGMKPNAFLKRLLGQLTDADVDDLFAR